MSLSRSEINRIVVEMNKFDKIYRKLRKAGWKPASNPAGTTVAVKVNGKYYPVIVEDNELNKP